jgi:hypothetical protein
MITLGTVLVVFDCFEEDGSFDTGVETKAAGFIIMAIPTKSKTAKIINKRIELFMFYLQMSFVIIILNAFLPIVCFESRYTLLSYNKLKFDMLRFQLNRTHLSPSVGFI